MPWTAWKAALALMLVGGLAWGQQVSTQKPDGAKPDQNGPMVPDISPQHTASARASASNPVAQRPPNMVRVLENGYELHCRVLASWQTAQNQQAYQVRVIGSTERLTLVAGSETGNAVQIYHWGRRTTSPPGVPVPSDPAAEEERATITMAQATESTPTNSDQIEPSIPTSPDGTEACLVLPDCQPPAVSTIRPCPAPLQSAVDALFGGFIKR